MNIADYLAIRGHQKKLREALGISKAQVHQWYKCVREVPLKYMARIEQATDGQVTRKDLCPDWQTHWPELAYPSSAQPMRGAGKRSAALLAPRRPPVIEPAGGGLKRFAKTKAAI